MCTVRSKRRRLVTAARGNIRHLADLCKPPLFHPSDLTLRSSADFFWDLEFGIGRLPARSARAASSQLRREHHSAIFIQEGAGDAVYETGHAVRCVKRHARVGGARFCPPPVGNTFENQSSLNVSLGMVWMRVSCRGRTFMQMPNI